MNKEESILNKLLKLAEKQQKILIKLAQVAQDESQANIQYLKNTWQTAAVNSGVTRVSTPDVRYTPPGQVNETKFDGDYTVSGEIPAPFRDKMLKTFKAQVASQKPNLDGKVSMIFNDITT